MAHEPKQCMVSTCKTQAEYWIDTEGFLEPLLSEAAPDTFYLCVDHMNELEGSEENAGSYVHLRVDTGEIHSTEIAKYCCSDDCEECLSS